MNKLVDGEVGVTQKSAQKTSAEFFVVWDSEGGFLTFLGEDPVAAAPSNQDPPSFLESFRRFPTGDNWKLAHLDGDFNQFGVVDTPLSLGLLI